MNRYGVFASIFAILQFSSFMSFAQDMGGGAEAGENSSEEVQDDNTQENATDEDVGDVELDDETDTNETALSDEEVQAAREIIAERDRTQMLKSVESSIQKRTPDFQMDKVVAGLKELNKTNPELAAYYNASEAGLEMYYRDNLQNVASSDAINIGSHSGSNGDFDSILEKAQAGDKKSQKLALAQSKA